MIANIIKQAVDAAQVARPDLKALPLESGGYGLLSNEIRIARIGIILGGTPFVESAGGLFQLVAADRAEPAVLATLLLAAVEDGERALAA